MKQQRINSIWAFISSDEEGEGVIGVQLNDMHLPLIAADEVRLKSLRPVAEKVARETNRTVKLIRLTTREDIEEIKP